MGLDQKRRSLFAGNVDQYRPKPYRLDGEEVIYVRDLPYELEDIALRWLFAYPVDRTRIGPRGVAVTSDGYDEMIGWMLNRLDEDVRELPLHDAGQIEAFWVVA